VGGGVVGSREFRGGDGEVGAGGHGGVLGGRDGMKGKGVCAIGRRRSAVSGVCCRSLGQWTCSLFPRAVVG
jgi:hypothetical protein